MRLMMILATPLLSACTVYLGPGSSAMDGDSSGADAPTYPLPMPSIQRVDPPVLDAEQQKRQDEVDHYLTQEYQGLGWIIKDTIQTYDNDIVDWVDPSTVEGSDAEPPPPRMEATMLPSGVELQRTELDEHPELRGPDGTIPILRPSFSAYVSGASGATSLSDYLENHIVVGAPVSPQNFYAGMSTVADNAGAAVWVTAFGGDIEPMTMSVLEMIVGCPDDQGGMEWVGIAAVRDAVNVHTAFHPFRGSVPRLEVEYVVPDPTKPEKISGGWDGLTRTKNVFKKHAGSRYYPGIELQPATKGGPQVESYFVIQLFNKQWWLGYNGDWLGYYESSLFKDMNAENPNAKGVACVVKWYGEIYDRSPYFWTWTDMGSGEFADQGHGNAAYFRDPFYADPAGMSHWPDNSSYTSPFNDSCYTRSPLNSGVSPWDRWFFVGGPGSDAPDCE